MGDNTRERSAWSDAVATQIRIERGAKRWTLEQMAQAAGIPYSTYRRLDNGQRVADTTQLARICGAVNLPLSQFFLRVEQRNPEVSPPLD